MPLLIYFPFIVWSGIVVHMCQPRAVPCVNRAQRRLPDRRCWRAKLPTRRCRKRRNTSVLA